jgi:hypothetical protein
MTTYKAVRIPWQINQPVVEVEYDDANPDNLNTLVFGKYEESLALGYSTFRGRKVQMFYDDLGLYRTPKNVNLRAMELWAHLAGRRFSEFHQPLVGDFIVFGLREYDGESDDIPADVLAFSMSMNSHIHAEASDG